MGRLPQASEWNLSPLDERWETIEQAERFTAKRVVALRRPRSGWRASAMERSWCASVSHYGRVRGVALW